MVLSNTYANEQLVLPFNQTVIDLDHTVQKDMA